jgi:hypothetical protein
MRASSETMNKLVRLREELGREFPQVADDHLDRQVRAVVDDLLARARFDAFVPLLARRYLREQLAAGLEGLAAPTAAPALEQEAVATR